MSVDRVGCWLAEDLKKSTPKAKLKLLQQRSRGRQTTDQSWPGVLQSFTSTKNTNEHEGKGWHFYLRGAFVCFVGCERDSWSSATKQLLLMRTGINREYHQ